MPQDSLSHCWSPDTGQDSVWIFQNDSYDFGKAFKTKKCPVPQNGLSYCWSPYTGQDSLWILQNKSYNFGKFLCN